MRDVIRWTSKKIFIRDRFFNFRHGGNLPSTTFGFTKSGAGFTLIELLVVIFILSFIATLAMATITSARERARTAKASADIRNIRQAVALLVDDLGKWPNGCEVDKVVLGIYDEIEVHQSCAALSAGPEPGVCALQLPWPFNQCQWTAEDVNKWNGPYLSAVPETDPWGTPYYFDIDYTPYKDCPSIPEKPMISAIVSYGPDKEDVPGPLGSEYGCDDIFVDAR